MTRTSASLLDEAVARVSVLADAPMATVVLDLEGRVRLWNRAAEQLTGWTAEQALGELPPYVPEEHLLAFRARHAEAIHADPLPRITVQRRNHYGATRDVAIVRWPLRAADGETVAIAGVLTDITDQRREEESQRRAEANLRTIIERSPDGITVHRFGQIVFVNTRLVAMLGYDHAEQLIGRSPLLLVEPDERERAEERIRGIVAGHDSPLAHMRLIRRDGATLHTEISGHPVVFDGQPSVLAYVRDLTERHRLEAELRARERLASVGRLAAAIGHEINNPLTYVIGNIELALRALGASFDDAARAKAERLLAAAGEGGQRIRHIVRDLRMFSQTERDEAATVDISRVLDSALAIADHEVRHRARVRRAYAGLPQVLGSDARLGQVFLNLLVNAAQAIPAGRIDSNEIAVEGSVEGERVVVVVRDTGIGIDAEAQKRVFEPFFTTKPEHGTGLGLAICRSIVSSIGGDIEIESESGHGTRVTIRLLRAPPSAVRTPRPALGEDAHLWRSKQDEAAQRTPRVLVVDDEPRIARVVAALLPEVTSVLAESGEDALERLRCSEPFDAVLCDIMMPRMTGMDLYERARELRPGVEQSFVFMSGGAFTSASTRFLASVPNTCLEKPFSATQLRDALAAVLSPDRAR